DLVGPAEDARLRQDELELDRIGVAERAPELLEALMDRAGQVDVDAQGGVARAGGLVAKRQGEGAPGRAAPDRLHPRLLDARVDGGGAKLELEEAVVDGAELDGHAAPGRLAGAAAVAGHRSHVFFRYQSTVLASPSSKETGAV